MNHYIMSGNTYYDTDAQHMVCHTFGTG